MLFHVPRTCTEKVDESIAESYPIAYFRERAAYVLLGEPGAGKSSLFEAEANNTNDGLCISARDFIALDREEWRDKTLFIDGLDEARAGNDNARTPLDALRGKLNKLGCKRFRISCRAADWLGSLDTKDIKQVSPDQKISVLHLDPLSSDDINQILHQDQRITDAKDFIEKAEQFGLSGLLENPQTLDMLIAAVKGGQQWPTSKLEVYELASKQLAAEFNDEHSEAQRPTSTIPLLEAAGFLCAIQIIANVTGFTENQTTEGRICLKDINIPEGLLIRAAFKTRLFNRINADESSYIHRSVAEYLAAQFIAGKIKEGLLFNRVLALTTGFDGGIVAALRGLMAWLSVLSPQARERLIEIDPLGVVIYGDARLFSVVSKVQLLEAAQREFEKKIEWSIQSFETLTTPDMVTPLLTMFNNPGRKDAEQNLLYCLLSGLCHSECIPELKQGLLTIIRDNSYWSDVRTGALYAFLHQHPNDTDSLLELADNICQNSIEDDNRLLGILLPKLFPGRIAASEILNYIKPINENWTIGHYDYWDTVFVSSVTNNDLPVVLDDLATRDVAFFKVSHHQDLFNMAGQLLVRGIQTYGNKISPERLYQWLAIGFNQNITCYLTPLHQQQVCEWLEIEPERYLTLLEIGIRQIQNPNEIYGVFVRFYYARPPDRLGLWWLEKALSAATFDLGCVYFKEAFWTLEHDRGNQGLSLEFFEAWLQEHPQFQETYQSLIFWPIEDWRITHAQSQRKWKNQRAEELFAKLAYLTKNRDKIAEGSANPQIFNQIAIAFNHQVQIADKTLDERLSEYLEGDVSLIAAAKSGLRKILNRTDLPTTKEIFSLAAKGDYHYIRLPFLVCMDTLYQENPSMLNSLSDTLTGQAFAFCFTKGALLNDSWVIPLIRLHPILAAQLFIEYVSLMFKSKNHIHGLHLLAQNDDFEEITKLTTIPLLNKYPIRCKTQQLPNLEYLLKAAINYVKKDELLPLIEKKLTSKGMDIAQRIYWLAAGLLIEPMIYEPLVRQEINGNTIRINHLSAFLDIGWRLSDVKCTLSKAAIGLLVELFATRSMPVWTSGGGRVTRSMEERDFVRSLLNKLSEDPSEDSANVLEHLLTLPQLSAWHPLIRNAQQTQQLSRREALFKHPNATQVINTLSNSKPANVADLTALTVDCLGQLAAEMHGSSSDSYKQFWNVDCYGKPTTYRIENICRNYLFERLKAFLAKYNIQVDLEVHQAKDKRVDLKISFTSEGKTFHLPIEIKCDYNDKLWKTIHEQLIPLYTIAPETEGRGLFLVIWFNHAKMPTHPQGLPPPKSAEQLAAMLKDTMTPQEQKLIDVFVLDVSKKD